MVKLSPKILDPKKPHNPINTRWGNDVGTEDYAFVKKNVPGFDTAPNRGMKGAYFKTNFYCTGWRKKSGTPYIGFFKWSILYIIEYLDYILYSKPYLYKKDTHVQL